MAKFLFTVKIMSGMLPIAVLCVGRASQVACTGSVEEIHMVGGGGGDKHAIL